MLHNLQKNKKKEVIMRTTINNGRSGFYFAHPLKEEFRKRKIPLWCLRNFTGVSEPKLSRYLNNIDRMPFDVEMRLQQMVDIMNGDHSSLGLNQNSNNEKPASNINEKK